MNRPSRRRRKEQQAIRPWTYDQAKAALPYLRSVMSSLRNHSLEAQAQDLRARRLADRPGRPDRTALLTRQEALDEAQKARDRAEEDVEELSRLDVYCLDPLNGFALVPFVHQEQLAWYVFDLFAENMLDTWRYHEDPPEVRRPIRELDDAQPAQSFFA
jgi:hypothetical protein